MEFQYNKNLTRIDGTVIHVLNNGESGDWRGIVEVSKSTFPVFVSSSIPLDKNKNDKISVVGKKELSFNEFLSADFTVDNSIEARINSIKDSKFIKLKINSENKNFLTFIEEFIKDNFSEKTIILANSTERKEDIDLILLSKKIFNIQKQLLISDESLNFNSNNNILYIKYLDKQSILEDWYNDNEDNIFFPKEIPNPSEIRRFKICNNIAEYIKSTNENIDKDNLAGILFLSNGGNIKTIDYIISKNTFSQLYKENLDNNTILSLINAKEIFLSKKNQLNNEDYIELSLNSNKQKINPKIFNKVILKFKECYPEWESLTAIELSNNIKLFANNLNTNNIELSKTKFNNESVKNIKKLMLNMSISIKNDVISPKDFINKKSSLLKIIKNGVLNFINDTNHYNSGDNIVKLINKSQSFFRKKVLNSKKNISKTINFAQPILAKINAEVVRGKFFNNTKTSLLFKNLIATPMLKLINKLPINTTNNDGEDTFLFCKYVNSNFKKTVIENKKNIIDIVEKYKKSLIDNSLYEQSMTEENPVNRLNNWGNLSKVFINKHNELLKKEALSKEELDYYNFLGNKLRGQSYFIFMDKPYNQLLSNIDNPYNDLSLGVRKMLLFKPLKEGENLKSFNIDEVVKGYKYISNPTIILNYKHNLYLTNPNDKKASQLNVDGNLNKNVDWDKISSFSHAILKNIKFQTEDLEYKKINEAQFYNCDFSKVDGKNMKFINCDFKECSGLNKTLNLNKSFIEDNNQNNKETDIIIKNDLNKKRSGISINE